MSGCYLFPIVFHQTEYSFFFILQVVEMDPMNGPALSDAAAKTAPRPLPLTQRRRSSQEAEVTSATEESVI